MSPKPENTIVRITPQLAARWLKQNTDNRPLRRTWIENYKEAFARGEYVLSHQGIAFSDDILVDGQHRLTAISEMPPNFSVEMFVCRGVDPKARNVMDIGNKRTHSDILKEERKLVECARFLAKIYEGRANGITPTFLIPFVERLRAPHADLLDFCATACRTWSSAPIRSAVCVVSMAGGDVDYAKLIYRAMVTKEFTSMPRSAQALFRAHINGTVRAAQATDMFVRALKIFNQANADLTKIQIKDTSFAIEQVRTVIRAEIFGATTRQAKAAPAPAPQRRAASTYALAGV